MKKPYQIEALGWTPRLRQPESQWFAVRCCFRSARLAFYDALVGEAETGNAPRATRSRNSRSELIADDGQGVILPSRPIAR